MKKRKKNLIIETLKNLLWPEVCPFCGNVHRGGACPACQNKLEELFIREPRCMQCGKPVRNMEQEYCYDCAHTRHYYDQGRAVWLHRDPVKQSIYQFKYHNQREYGTYYAREMERCCGDFIRKINPEVLLPVPLHRRKRRKRGYNQAQILAQQLGERMGIPVETQLLVRVKNTRPQKKQDHRMRKENLRHAFALRYRIRNVRSVLIIDDIYTTGNTVDQIARILKEAGVEKVYFLTISIGQGN